MKRTYTYFLNYIPFGSFQASSLLAAIKIAEGLAIEQGLNASLVTVREA
ncbi:hypothetical protein EVC13_020 [Rhizobium phage RHph_I65]|nr:hypothetical protein EVC13_020 [Rhizobium phage RHph_I65]